MTLPRLTATLAAFALAAALYPDPRALGLAVFWGGCAVACVVAYCAGGMP